MQRRRFIGVLGGMLAWPIAVRAQQRSKVWRVGFISGLARPSTLQGTVLSGLPQGMSDLGYVEGRDYIIEWRFADGKYDRYAEIASELVNLKVDVIVLGTASAVRPVQQTTKTIPIVLGYSTDPVGNGFVESLSRPGGNVTGLASSADDTAPKQIELALSLVPNLTRMAVLVNPDSPNKVVVEQAEAAARKARISLSLKQVRSQQEIEAAFVAFRRESVEAVLVVPDALFNTHTRLIAKLAIDGRLPTVSGQLQYVEAGALIAYGESLHDFFRRAATFVDKILKGAKPGQLPIEQPTRFFLVINMKTAKALSLEVPPTLLTRADQLIE